jgi:membrane protein YqaA with SNARE-associated domain
MTTLLSLFLGALLAATILPFSSELMLAAAVKAGAVPVPWLIAAATLGNVAGATVNWGLGRYARHWVGRRWFPVSAAQIDRAAQRFNRYGTWSLFFAFLPVVGDPLTVAAGMLQVPLPRFLILVTLGKAARYAFIGWAV